MIGRLRASGIPRAGGVRDHGRRLSRRPGPWRAGAADPSGAGGTRSRPRKPGPGRPEDPRPDREGRDSGGPRRGDRRRLPPLGERIGRDAPDVAVRSSATAEDLPGASFAGQLETFLNVRGRDALLDAVRRCFASLFTDRAIAYREEQGFDHMKVAVSVGVQRMVRSDKAGSGVMFSIDTETGFPRSVLVNAAWGLGETVVQGIVEPDEYHVFKPLLDRPDLAPIVEKRLGSKARRMIYAGRGNETKTVDTDRKARGRFRPDRRRGADAGPLGDGDRDALRPADGHGMGQGRRHGRPLHRPGPAGDGAGGGRGPAQDLQPGRPWRPAGERPRDRRRRGHGQGCAGWRAPTRSTGSRTGRSWSPA